MEFIGQEENIEFTEVSPITSLNYQPEISGDEEIIAQISPAKFDSLIKVLEIFTSDKNNTVVINQSTMKQSSTYTISANIEQIFDNKLIDFHIVNPKKYIKLFKSFKNNNDIFIIDDKINVRFIVTNGEIRLFLPKQVESLVNEVSLPDVTNMSLVCDFKIDKVTRKVIAGLISDANYLDFLLQDDKVKAIHIPDTAIYVFPEYINDPNAKKLDETNAQMILRTNVFPTIVAENYHYAILKESDDKYLCIIRCNMGFVDVDIYDFLEVATGGGLLI